MFSSDHWQGSPYFNLIHILYHPSPVAPFFLFLFQGADDALAAFCQVQIQGNGVQSVQSVQSVQKYILHSQKTASEKTVKVYFFKSLSYISTESTLPPLVVLVLTSPLISSIIITSRSEWETLGGSS